MTNQSLVVADDMVVRIDYTLTLANGEIYDSSDETGPLEYVQGQGHIISGLEEALNGMAVGEEIAIGLEQGKSLVLRLQAIGETDEEGQVRVFFELNGQPRIARVPNRAAVAKLPARRKAEDGNDAHVAAPMPGSVSTISVRVGQPIKAGDVLLTIEAMKMETALHAPRDGTVKEILVHAASPIDAKDLLVVLEA